MPTTTSGSIDDVHVSFLAYERVLPDAEAIPAADLRNLAIKPGQLGALVLGTQPAIISLHEQLEATFKKYDKSMVRVLKDTAYALFYAEILVRQVEDPETRAAPLLEEAKPLRAKLLRWAEPLAAEGWFDRDVIADIRSKRGHLETAMALIQLSNMFQQVWDRFGGNPIITEEEIDRAGELGSKLAAAVGEDRYSGQLEEVSNIRNRMLHLLFERYRVLRLWVHLIRDEAGHNDGDTFCPSPYVGRGRRPGDNGQARPEPTPEPTPAPEPTPN